MTTEKTARQYFDEFAAFCNAQPDREHAQPALRSLENALEWIDPEALRLAIEGARENDLEKIQRSTEMVQQFSASLALQLGNRDVPKADA